MTKMTLDQSFFFLPQEHSSNLTVHLKLKNTKIPLYAKLIFLSQRYFCIFTVQRIIKKNPNTPK